MSLNCSSSRLTSFVGRPEPFAMRERRDPLIIVGFLRSSGVIDSTIASTCFMRFGSRFACLSIFEFTPGSIFRMPSIGPSFCIWRMAVSMSFRSMPSLRTFFSSFFASASSNARLRLLDERDDVAHLQNATGHALGMELLERVRLFADTDVLDRLLRDAVDRERRAAARVAVELRQDDAGDA